ncbi:hypothetical protein EDB89DRAFT_1911716 [Lactarius sanguifluus]|nr:hypothetical protein EDB89DRAFT_1911716 [Lactarius sanguifluus]
MTCPDGDCEEVPGRDSGGKRQPLSAKARPGCDHSFFPDPAGQGQGGNAAVQVAIRRDDRDHGSHRKTQDAITSGSHGKEGLSPKRSTGPPTTGLHDDDMLWSAVRPTCLGIGPEADKALSALEVLWSLFVHYGGHPGVAGDGENAGAGTALGLSCRQVSLTAVGHENLTSRLQQTIDPWACLMAPPSRSARDPGSPRYDAGVKAKTACPAWYDEKFSEEAGKDETDAVIDERSAPRHARNTLSSEPIVGPATSPLSSRRGNCVAPDGVWLLLFRCFNSRACA